MVKNPQKIILCSIILILLFILCLLMYQNKKFNDENIIIPKIVTGFIYNIDDNQVIFKFDLKDKKQKLLVKDIIDICRMSNIKECTAKDILLG